MVISIFYIVFLLFQIYILIKYFELKTLLVNALRTSINVG